MTRSFRRDRDVRIAHIGYSMLAEVSLIERDFGKSDGAKLVKPSASFPASPLRGSESQLAEAAAGAAGARSSDPELIEQE